MTPAPARAGWRSADLRALDEAAWARFGLPTLALMENAGRAVAAEAIGALERRARRRRGSTPRREGVLVVCGGGNNGGDGHVAARHLIEAGIPTWITEPGPLAERGDAGIMRGVTLKMGISIRAWNPSRPAGLLRGVGIVVDAVWGTGLSRPLDERGIAVISAINAMRARGATVVSVDVPSGMDADSGRPRPVCVRADVTVTFVGIKAGFLKSGDDGPMGRLVVARIGMPRRAARARRGPG